MTINTQRLRRIGHAVELELGRESGLIIQQAADEIEHLRRIIDPRPIIAWAQPLQDKRDQASTPKEDSHD